MTVTVIRGCSFFCFWVNFCKMASAWKGTRSWSNDKDVLDLPNCHCSEEYFSMMGISDLWRAGSLVKHCSS